MKSQFLKHLFLRTSEISDKQRTLLRRIKIFFPSKHFKNFLKFYLVDFWYGLKLGLIALNIQGGPERSRQSNLAVFTVEDGLDSKFPCVK